MTEWRLFFHWREKDEWRLWVRGSLEDVLSDAMDNWPYDVDAIRIEREKTD